MATVDGNPQVPNVTDSMLRHQVRVDACGKEVQVATTYSWAWSADQFGHMCIGIMAHYLARLVLSLLVWLFGPLLTLWLAAHFPSLPLSVLAELAETWGSLVLGVVGVGAWEWHAYTQSVKDATGLFPVDRQLLKDNAWIAAFYMALGVVFAALFRVTDLMWQLAGLTVAVVAGLLLAKRWLRQKIIWQKAALPYLCRLADVQRTIGVDKAQQLQTLIDAGAPPAIPPRQIIIGGPIASGRTDIALGIGTEFAFKGAMVRYVGIAALLEFAAQQPVGDDNGPDNVDYWKWYQAQVLIIDDVGPMIAAYHEDGRANLDRFSDMLQAGLGPIAGLLAERHTVWVLGDLRAGKDTSMKDGVLNSVANKIAGFCNARNALVVELTEVRGTRPAKPSQEIVYKGTADIREVTRQE
jgi:hypothetical protein